MKSLFPFIAAAIAGLTAPALAQTAAERLGIPAPDAREGRTLSVDGAEIFHSSSGEGDAVVLLHGYPLSGALFERVRDRLDDDYRVVTIDHRGYGQSTTPEPVTDVATYASDALAVLEELGIESAAIGGMSMGGPILFEMYRQNPDVFAAAMLIDTNHMPAGAIEAGIWNGAHAALEENDAVSAIIPFLMPNMLTGETRLVEAPAQVDYLTQAMEQASLDGALGGATVLANRPDSTETLRSMDVPILVVVGREDTVYPVAISEAMVEAAPDAELAVIEGASHAAVFERPEAAAQAMADFLAANF
jgi:pimeloyl-ACP methyl ester carboxylesterase